MKKTSVPVGRPAERFVDMDANSAEGYDSAWGLLVCTWGHLA